ncbi:MAG: hypothetical protein AB9888_12895 [Bacteroidales bacterium]
MPSEWAGCVYEERLRAILSDQVIGLLEDSQRLRQFTQCYFFGQAVGKPILVHGYQIPQDWPDAAVHFQWVWRLTTGPFADAAHTDLAGNPLPAQHIWLTKPEAVLPPLYRAAEAYVLDGKGYPEVAQGNLVGINFGDVLLEILRQAQNVGNLTPAAPAGNLKYQNLSNRVAGIAEALQKAAAEKDLALYGFYLARHGALPEPGVVGLERDMQLLMKEMLLELLNEVYGRYIH